MSLAPPASAGDLDGLMHAILTCVTAGPGLGFNRAALLLADDRQETLRAVGAIGAASPEEAHATWQRLAAENPSLDDLLQRRGAGDEREGFHSLLQGLSIPLGEPAGGAELDPLAGAYWNRRPARITDPASLRHLPPRLREVFQGTEVCCVPLCAQQRPIGLIVADNAYTREPIGEDRIRLLQLLALLAGLALDNARINAQLERQAAELRDALVSLQTTHDQLVRNERLAAIGSVVARVSHEIRNPLVTIGGFARALLAPGNDPARAARNVGIIVAEVEQLEELLKELLDFTGPRPPRLAPVDLNAVLRDVADVHAPGLEEHRIGLRLELASDLPKAAADVDQLHRVCLNLWQNAVQAMAATGRAGTLTIRTERAGDRVRIAFIDTGEGIRPENLGRIFEPFFTTRRQGTGLGLAVVRQVVEDHGGEITVENGPESGAMVRIALPTTR